MLPQPRGGVRALPAPKIQKGVVKLAGLAVLSQFEIEPLRIDKFGLIYHKIAITAFWVAKAVVTIIPLKIGRSEICRAGACSSMRFGRSVIPNSARFRSRRLPRKRQTTFGRGWRSMPTRS